MGDIIQKHDVPPDEFTTCKQCGYTGGFHVVFRYDEALAGLKLFTILRCPNCHQDYNVGLVASRASGWGHSGRG